VLGASAEADLLRAVAGVPGGQIDSLAPEGLAGSDGALLGLLCNALIREALPGDGAMTQMQPAQFQRIPAAVVIWL